VESRPPRSVPAGEVDSARGGPGVADVVRALMMLRPAGSPRPLVRLGGSGDGAYLVPDDLDGVVACFSPGVDDRKDFEDELVDRYGMVCHLCDFSSDEQSLRTPLRVGMQTFTRRWLEPVDGTDTVSLATWVGERAPGDGDLMLQMDIEGAEYRNLLDAPDELLRRFRVIVLEMHDLFEVADPARFAAGPGALIERLNRHFQVVHAHANNCCGQVHYRPARMNVPQVIELTWLRRDRFAGSGRERDRGVRLPHPLDVRNVGHRPRIFLNAAWRRGSLPTIAPLIGEVGWAVRHPRAARRAVLDRVSRGHR